jgi:PilZ domain-containing protein
MTEKRSTPRQRTLKGGRIVFNNARSTFDCVIRNLSDKGARLEVASVIGMPDSFDLMLPDGTKRACQVIWRKPKEIGVAFG